MIGQTNRQTNRDYNLTYIDSNFLIFWGEGAGGEGGDKGYRLVVWKLFKEAGGGIEQKTCYLYDKCPK